MKRYLLLAIGLFMSGAALYAQMVSDISEQSYKRMYMVNLGLGLGCPDVWGDGSSSWAVGRNKNKCGFVSSAQLITYSSHSVVGYGLYYYDYREDTKKYDRVMPREIDEKITCYYVAPQVSFIKRHTAFPHGVGYVNAGVGYAHYTSKGALMQQQDYKTRVSGIGCNVGIAYEYVFDSRMGIRIAVDCMYARFKGLHDDKDRYPAGLSVLPRKKLHLVVPSLEIGLSYHIVRR